MSTLDYTNGRTIVLVDAGRGVTVIPSPTPLTRLNYFDGKFLRADDLRAEQEYLRRLVELSNQSGGAGIAYGFDTTLGSGDSIAVGPGLAIDGRGRVLLLPFAHTVPVQDLLDRSRGVPRDEPAKRGRRRPLRRALEELRFEECEEAAATATASVAAGGGLYLITVGHAEGRCGEEDVYGRLCEDACVTSSERPYVVEGVIVRAIPLTLETPFPQTGVALDGRHLRSLVASAYFADEARRAGTLISADGLGRDAWCLGSRPVFGEDVPLAVIQRVGSTTGFLDAWTARRERIEPGARRYWAGRMAMRPWDVFLAHVLQFQCQLLEVLVDGGGPAGPTDPCAPQTEALVEAQRFLALIEAEVAEAEPAGEGARRVVSAREALAPVDVLRAKIQTALEAVPAALDRILIRRGIVELPSAGYLPVNPVSTIGVERQVRRLLGEGLDLRFCVVRPDFVPHALEEAQHMERISLLTGLDDPAAKPKVDVLVPNGRFGQRPAQLETKGWDTLIGLSPLLLSRIVGGGVRPEAVFRRAVVARTDFRLVHGAGRSDARRSEAEFTFAGLEEQVGTTPVIRRRLLRRGDLIRRRAERAAEGSPAAGYGFVRCEGDVFADTTLRLRGEGALGSELAAGPIGFEGEASIQVQVESRASLPGGGVRVEGKGTLKAEGRRVGGTQPGQGEREIEVQAELELRPASPPTARLEVRTSEGDPICIATWQGDPLTATVVAGLELGPTPAPVPAPGAVGDVTPGLGAIIGPGPAPFPIVLAAAKVIEDDDALQEGHELGEDALDGLETLGRVLGGERYSRAADRLFAPLQQTPTEPTLAATLDWVLFHRRRDKDCGTPPPITAPPATESQLVYRIRAESLERLPVQLADGGIQAALRLSPPTLTRVGKAEFAGGAADLTSSQPALAQAWQAAGGGRVTGGIVAAQSAPSSPDAALEGRRGSAISVALGGTPTLRYQAVADSPPEGAEAVTFLAATVDTPVDTVCHEVFRIDIDGGNADEVATLLSDFNLAELAQKSYFVSIGTAVFEKGTTRPVSDTLQPQAVAFGAAPPVKVWTTSQPPETSQVLEQQALAALTKAIGQLPQGTAGTVLSPEDDTVPGGCPVLTTIELDNRPL